MRLLLPGRLAAGGDRLKSETPDPLLENEVIAPLRTQSLRISPLAPDGVRLPGG
jgi:hypothetical protein